ncbi:hypothetical protein EVAR_99598_1 [Eumeta japonica]|uniref:Uncharacterized protein n=1 Tax=Eumeta variegata TaxID=151549 RepID=A0A4C1ZX77_EUMVA|nr:hypothetical protein EVAR_99598_1 [Eumeta japonica]
MHDPSRFHGGVMETLESRFIVVNAPRKLCSEPRRRVAPGERLITGTIQCGRGTVVSIVLRGRGLRHAGRRPHSRTRSSLLARAEFYDMQENEPLSDTERRPKSMYELLGQTCDTERRLPSVHRWPSYEESPDSSPATRELTDEFLIELWSVLSLSVSCAQADVEGPEGPAALEHDALFTPAQKAFVLVCRSHAVAMVTSPARPPELLKLQYHIVTIRERARACICAPAALTLPPSALSRGRAVTKPHIKVNMSKECTRTGADAGAHAAAVFVGTSAVPPAARRPPPVVAPTAAVRGRRYR